ncbi:ABC transporter ATP-binding protein [Adlercreutzia sp. ZJ473]|uniref:ABC transporter ATP-binding protein n=1 Tax=Adlercreutzia sp. ZJ473 TaxID=2722822 RepID=UPI0015582EC1|nr:ABC transporter ATP-binding protein [Adlercreutzia sp. ZJ473]
MLDVSNLRFSYRRGREVLKGVSFSIDRGEILCLLGSNGTGKTTLLRCLLGFEKPDGGRILVDGEDVTRMRLERRARYLAYVPQSTSIAFPYTAREVVLMGRVAHLATGASHTARDMQVVDEAMERLQIAHLAECRYQEMSGGERQMVLVARALAQDARLLVMDEPTANLDYHNQVKILTALKYLAGQGLGILMTSHYPDHAFLACTKAALMKGGALVDVGPPDDIVTSESLTNLYDTPVHVGGTFVGGLVVKTCIPLLDETVYARVQADAEGSQELDASFERA